jgi:hypothetical protein
MGIFQFRIYWTILMKFSIDGSHGNMFFNSDPLMTHKLNFIYVPKSAQYAQKVYMA